MNTNFYVSKKHQMLLLSPENAGVVCASLPTAKVADKFVAVPHRVRETRILNSLGFKIPSPIYYYYSWPNSQGYSPWFAQSETAAFLTMNRNAFVLNEIGTGKTNAAAWALDFMLQQGDVDKCLIMSPLSTLNRVWGDAFWMDFHHLKFKVLHGSRAKRLQLLEEDVDVYIINPDGPKIIYDELMARKDIGHIIVDEIAEFRKAKTDKYKALRNLIHSGRTVWGMTGTPIPNDPTDAWAQCRLINPANVSPYFNRFRIETMTQITEYKWIAKPDALSRVHAAMQPAIRFTRDETLDLPPATYVDLEVELSAEQKKAYKEMANSLYTEFEKGEVVAANEGVKMSKLIQIAAGVVYDSEGVPHYLDCKSRVRELIENIQRAGTKVIVFVPFKAMTYMVAKEIEKQWSVAVVNGDVSAKKRDQIFTDFQSKPDPHVLVAHPKCMSHGLTLTEASTIIWYAPYAHSEAYTQANGRISRAPQKNNQLYIHLQGTEIERRIYKKLRDNQSLQGTLLDMFSEKK